MPAKKWLFLALGVVLALIVLASLDQGTQWDGVDTAVVGRFGADLGRAPSKPLFDLQGDSLLFAFAISAAMGGFVAGYYWRELFGNVERATEDKRLAAGSEVKRDV
jgi:cobalt/nickel transport protein